MMFVWLQIAKNYMPQRSGAVMFTARGRIEREEAPAAAQQQGIGRR